MTARRTALVKRGDAARPQRRRAQPEREAAPADRGASPKRDSIEKAAARVFLRDGYAGASMDAIAREAGVSKATLYSHFQGKEDLFGAIARSNCQQFAVDVQASAAAGAAPAEVLRTLGRRFLGNMLSKDMLALFRILVAEAHRFPTLGRAVQSAGPGPSCNVLATYFREMTARGVLAVAEPDIAADQFFGALLGGVHFRRLLGVEKAPSEAEIERRVAAVVDAFLAAHAPSRRARAG